MRKKTIFNVTFRIGDSHFWTLLSFCTRVFGNGRRTRFLEDECVGGKPVANQFPMLYNLTLSQDISVAKITQESPGALRFRRIFVGETLDSGIC